MKAIDMSTVVYVLIMILVFMSATAFWTDKSNSV